MSGESLVSGVNKVWVIGSSIVKRASIASRERKGELNLGIANTEIWWQGYGGMDLSQLLPKLRVLRRIENDPDIFIIHCGANSLGLIH
uniref:SGNH hydrolase-type esterase domain-containing protein n=1 Tax=Magallana gigas TaxID=29159 RepID=K1P0J6_MAGGI